MSFGRSNTLPQFPKVHCHCFSRGQCSSQKWCNNWGCKVNTRRPSGFHLHTQQGTNGHLSPAAQRATLSVNYFFWSSDGGRTSPPPFFKGFNFQKVAGPFLVFSHEVIIVTNLVSDHICWLISRLDLLRSYALQ